MSENLPGNVATSERIYDKCERAGIAKSCCCCEYFCCRCEYSADPNCEPCFDWWCGRTGDSRGSFELNPQKLLQYFKANPDRWEDFEQEEMIEEFPVLKELFMESGREGVVNLIPNEETQAAINAARAGETTPVGSSSELFAELEVKPKESSTWFRGFCNSCGSKLVVCQTDCSLQEYSDYWWYCSQKGCENHDPGEQTGDMEEPSFLLDLEQEKSEQRAKEQEKQMRDLAREALAGLQQFETVEATVNYRREYWGKLTPDAAALNGKKLKLTAAWIIEDGPCVGEWAMQTDSGMPAYIPSGDLVDIVREGKRLSNEVEKSNG